MIALNEVFSLTFMAIAMSMDAFSVSLGLGMRNLRLKRIMIIGFVMGLFHILFPLTGMILGKILSSRIGEFATFTGGFLLIAIGAHMFFSAFTHGEEKEKSSLIQPIGFGLILLATTVSIDSFSIGLSLGISGVQIVLALFLFGSTGVIFTWSGLLLGRKVRGFLGAYSELLGGSILFSFGLKILFG